MAPSLPAGARLRLAPQNYTPALCNQLVMRLKARLVKCLRVVIVAGHARIDNIRDIIIHIVVIRKQIVVLVA